MTDWWHSSFDFLLSRPLLLMTLIAMPWLMIARWKMVYPTQRSLCVFAVPAALSLILLGFPAAGWIVLAVDLIAIITIIFDLYSVAANIQFSAQRRIPKISSIMKPQFAEVELQYRGSASCWLTLRDDSPEQWELDPAEFATLIPPTSRTRFRYRYIAHERGRQQLAAVYLRVESRWKLWRAYYQLPCESTVHVYPDMKQMHEYELLARTNRLSLLGVRRSRKIGQDHDFERLRDYSSDDNYKLIDWRTTARRRKLTVRDFQSTQSQRVIFLVDCGRMMTNISGSLTLLDHAFNAMLMLSYVALKRGDAVGCLSFSDRIHNFTPPRNGTRQINRLLHATFDVQANYSESRYDEAFLYCRKHCRKRALVILITNVVDEVNAYQIQSYLSVINGQHLPLGVLLRDREIFEAIETATANTNRSDSLFVAAAAADVLHWRHHVIERLKHSGALTLDVFPDQLTSSLINQYLDIKARHLL